MRKAEMNDQNHASKLDISCQEGVKKMPMVFKSVIGSNDLRNLRLELSQSQSQFGLTLRRAIDPKAKHGYTRQYISRLEKGLDVITEDIQYAFWEIAAVHDGVRPGIAGTQPVTVMAAPGQIPDNAFIPRTAKAVLCARPGCGIWFIRTHPRQQYHDPECARKK